MRTRTIDVITGILVIIGGLNWGLWGLFEFDLVAAIFGGSTTFMAKLIYTIVGVSALYQAFTFRTQTRRIGVADTTTPTAFTRRAA